MQNLQGIGPIYNNVHRLHCVLLADLLVLWVKCVLLGKSLVVKSKLHLLTGSYLALIQLGKA